MVSIVWIIEKNRAWFLDTCVYFVKNLYFDACETLKANAFVYMYDMFEPNVHKMLNEIELQSAEPNVH